MSWRGPAFAALADRLRLEICKNFSIVGINKEEDRDSRTGTCTYTYMHRRMRVRAHTYTGSHKTIIPVSWKRHPDSLPTRAISCSTVASSSACAGAGRSVIFVAFPALWSTALRLQHIGRIPFSNLTYLHADHEHVRNVSCCNTSCGMTTAATPHSLETDAHKP